MEYMNFIDELKDHRQAIKDTNRKFTEKLKEDVDQLMLDNGYDKCDIKPYGDGSCENRGLWSKGNVKVYYTIHPSSSDPEVWFNMKNINFNTDSKYIAYKCKQPLDQFYKKRLLTVITELSKK
jgi:hypothetical protein